MAPLWFRRLCAWLAPRTRMTVINGDSLPEDVPFGALVVAREDGEDWCAGMRCPCGCGDVLEMMLLAKVKPRWDVRLDGRGRPSLHPSVWRNTGCRSHFWLRAGKVVWCE